MEELIGGLFLLALVGGMVALWIAALIYWVKSLVVAAKREDWGWFIVNLAFLGVIGALIYNATLPEDAKVRLRKRPQVVTV